MNAAADIEPDTERIPLGACRELAPSKQESTTYEPSLVCKLLILGCRLLIPDRLLERGDLDRAAALARIPGIHLGPERYRAERGGHSRVVRMAAAIERRNHADQAELAEHRSQVECAEAEVRDLEQQIRALDSAISAARRRVAWERIRTRPAAGLKAGVQWIRETSPTAAGSAEADGAGVTGPEIER